MATQWSGPGRALEAHLARWRQVHDENQAIAAGATSGLSILERWIRFASTYSRQAVQVGPDGMLVADGATMAEREVLLSYGRVPESIARTALMMLDTEDLMLDQATTHYLSAHMAALVTEAAELAENEPLFPSDVPCPSGFLVLERPRMCADLHPETGAVLPQVLPLRAIGWTISEVAERDLSGSADGLMVILYARAGDLDDLYAPAMKEIGQPDAAPLVGNGFHADDLIPVEFHPWQFGAMWDTASAMGEVDVGRIISSVADHRRWLLALWRLMWQRIIAPEPWHPDRAGHRRAERIRRRSDGERYSVMHLRRFVEHPRQRPKPDDDAWVAWPYPYRIPVRAHWRRQHFASLGPARIDGQWNPESHRLVFIERHYRGPDHLPVEERHDVTAVVR